MKSVTVNQTIEVLNRALAEDAVAVTALIGYRVPCNGALADDVTIQVGRADGGWDVGLLGIINGIFGVRADGWGYIAAETDGPRLVRFVATPEQKATNG